MKNFYQPSNPPKKAVVYARFSCDKQRDESIEDQLRVCSEYAEAHGIEIVGQYCDFAISGRTDHRPQFQQMIADATNGDFDCVLIYKTDRFSRDRYDSAIYKKKLAEAGVRVISATENIPTGGGGILVESLYEGMAQLYSMQISQNVKRAAKGNALKCKSNGGVTLFGYKVNQLTRQYEINEDEAPTLREMYAMAGRGEPLKAVMEYAKSKFPLKKWTYPKVRGMLSNERYTGVYIYDGIRQEGGMPALVSREDFDAVQRYFQTRRKNGDYTFKRYSRTKYLLSRRCFCGECSSTMTGETSVNASKHTYTYYHCMGHKMHWNNCSAKRIRCDKVDQAVTFALTRVLLQPDIFNVIVEKAMEKQRQRLKNASDVSLKQQLSEVKTRKTNLLNAIEAGIFTESTKARLKELEQQEKFLLENIKEERRKAAFTIISQPQYKNFLEKLQSGEIKSEKFVKSLFSELISQVFLWQDKISLVYNLKNEFSENVTSNMLKRARPLEAVATTNEKSHEHKCVHGTMSWLPE